MVEKGKSRKDEIVTREYTINLHKRLHSWYASPSFLLLLLLLTFFSSSSSLSPSRSSSLFIVFVSFSSPLLWPLLFRLWLFGRCPGCRFDCCLATPAALVALWSSVVHLCHVVCHLFIRLSVFYHRGRRLADPSSVCSRCQHPTGIRCRPLVVPVIGQSSPSSSLSDVLCLSMPFGPAASIPGCSAIPAGI